MSLKNVEQDIKRTIDSRIRKILDAGKKETTEILAEAKGRVKDLKTEMKRDVQAQVGQIRKRALASAELQARRALLEAKKDILDAVYEKMTDTISKMSSNDKTSLMKALVEKGQKELNAQYIYSNKKDADIVKRLSKGLTFEGTIECLGGVVLENKDKTVGIDYTFDVVLQDLRKETLGEVAKTLFEK